MDSGALHSVMVTGAGGFIGGRLVRRLLDLHCRVACLVRADSRVDELRSAGAKLVTGDVTDRYSVDRAISESGARTVFHLAGLVRALRPGDFTRVNVGGVETVAAACAACAIPPVLVVVSSLAAAGPCAAGQMRVEEDIPAPISNYGRSKLAGEQVAARYAGAVPISIVRPPIVFGPGDRGVLEIFRPIARWGLHIVPGRGDLRLSMIHVNDLVEGLMLAAEKGERLSEASVPGHGVYFIAGDGEDIPTYVQLGKTIAEALARKPPTVIHLPGSLMRLVGFCGDVRASIRRRPGWISGDKITEVLAGSWTCSSAKARRHLGWSPGATLAARLHETARFYHQEGWL